MGNWRGGDDTACGPKFERLNHKIGHDKTSDTVRTMQTVYVNQIIVTGHNETNSLSFMQRNLRHIGGGMMHYRLPPSDILVGRVPAVPSRIYATGIV